ncbi:MAG: glutaredoxin [Candidatus Latescibacteria bacterium]|jgi:monothiol glutaredoxin|nr:glutaredoxin [Candidatus Latescibacterota bacterium]
MGSVKPEITAYLKATCGWSRGVRAVLDKFGLAYEEKDILSDPAHFEEMVQKTGQTLQPCVEIDGQMLVDVSGDEVEAYLVEQGFESAGPDPRVPTDRSCSSEEHEAMARAQARPVVFNTRGPGS